MKKFGKIALLALMLCLFSGISAFASGEPSAGPVSEPIVGSEIRDRLSVDRFDVSFLVDGEECETADVEYTVEQNVYTFRLSELMEALGIEISYDEETRVVTVIPTDGGLVQLLSEKAARMTPDADAAADPLSSLTPAQAREMPVGAFFKKA